MARQYRYVGPEEIRQRVQSHSADYRIDTKVILRDWLLINADPESQNQVIATFIIDLNGHLRLAHRRSEHVACAGGLPVLSAGEMTYSIKQREPNLEEVSNQSTGYCPEPESWISVATALDRLGVEHSDKFTRQVTFRRCIECSQINVVKDGWFVCELCGENLPHQWNLAS